MTNRAMSREERAWKLVQHIYHMEDLADDADSIPMWAIKDAEATLMQACADERRRVGEELLALSKGNRCDDDDCADCVLHDWWEQEFRRICGAEGGDE